MQRQELADFIDLKMRAAADVDGSVEIRRDSRILDDLGIDSIGVVELITTIEDELGVSIPDSALVYKNMVVAGDLKDQILGAVAGDDGVR
ncbi:acyl carrier protein [Amycolatopsis sulphurea]|uniref:Acyl carrier protein n=1 Tax=Amycolatopsis sulphurea TaxID=76022 RepID=A0A2A9FFJ8_9PSEU|nr:phosphopantetheine-binding protein [Amycolatopsis sulphurea]PFG49938.1 acyl carrier protein [Amycolatopsis sulphurea]